ncbi:hypothetical protein F5J12DRAFT_688462, partial [Pisolithus orientalis]|uniref:uncharacterized protein n=1 Tax=Pisolithus orientalis TaxID=936130 RepID=UPI00222448FA
QGCLFGAFLWRSLSHIVQLVQNKHMKSDPAFVDLLGHVRIGNASTKTSDRYSDFNLLQSRQLTHLQKHMAEDFATFHSALIIFGEQHLCDRWNEEKALSFTSALGQELNFYYTEHFCQGECVTGTDNDHRTFVCSKESKDYLGHLPLLPGMPVLITENL